VSYEQVWASSLGTKNKILILPVVSGM
jgi:hypothetical protein